MTGSDVVRARQALGWTRAELVRRTGLPSSRVATIERSRVGWSGWEAGELETMTSVLKEALSHVEVKGTGGRAAIAVPESLDDDVVKTEKWQGLSKGDLVKLAGDAKPHRQYTFGFYFRNPAQEYVQVYAVKNGGGRCVRPETVLRKVKGKWEVVAC